MRDGEAVLIDGVLGKRLIAALKLQDLHVESVCISLRPGTLVQAEISIHLDREQLEALFAELARTLEDRR